MKALPALVLLSLAACGDGESLPSQPPSVEQPSYATAEWAEKGELYRCTRGGADVGVLQCQASLEDAKAYERTLCPGCNIICWKVGPNIGQPAVTCCARPPRDGLAGWLGGVCED